MTSRIYVVNALSKLLYLMLDESEYYKHYEIFAKNITSLVDLYRAYQKQSKDCKEIKIVVEQTPSERLETEEIKPSQELSQQLKLILESLDGNKAANAQMIYELIAALKLSELHEEEETNVNVGPEEEAAATKIQADFRGYKAGKEAKLLKAERAEAKKAKAAEATQAEAEREAAKAEEAERATAEEETKAEEKQDDNKHNEQQQETTQQKVEAPAFQQQKISKSEGEVRHARQERARSSQFDSNLKNLKITKFNYFMFLDDVKLLVFQHFLIRNCIF